MNKYAIGNNIIDRLRWCKMTQRELAARTGVTEVTLSRWINGNRQASSYGLYRISKVLNCTMEDLMKGIEE